MNIRFLALLACLGCLVTNGVAAQFFFNTSSEDEAVNADESAPQVMPKPISLLNEDDASAVEREAVADNMVLENYDPSVSYYIQNLNLTPEQMYEAQKISLDSLAEQEELLQKIAALRQRARALEVSSLMAFEAILDDAQRTAFQELRASYESSVSGGETENEASGE